MALAMAFLVSCGEEEPVGGGEMFDYESLDETGLAFVRAMQEDSEWLGAWDEVEKSGSPSPNDVFCACSPGNGNFLVLPVLSEGEVTHVVFYSLEEVGKPVIVGADCEDCPDFVRSFFDARCYVTWEKGGLTVSGEVKRAMWQKREASTVFAAVSAAASPGETVGVYVFPAEVWIEYTYVAGAEYSTFYQIMDEFERILQQMPMRVPDTRYELVNDGIDDLVYVGVVRHNWIEAERIAISAFDMMLGFLRTVPNVTYTWAVYQWERQPYSGDPGESGGWSPDVDDEDDGEEDDEATCPDCHKSWERCECEGLRMVVEILEKEVALGTEFYVGIYAFGKDRSRIEFVNVQMKREREADWRSIGYMDLSKINQASMFKMYNPGVWEIRAGVTFEGVDGIIYDFSQEASFTILWPSIDEFRDDPVVVACLEEMWAKSVAFAEQNQSTHAVREFGGAVIMDYAGTISCKESPEPGPVVYLDKAGVHGSLTFVETDYVDVSESNDPKSVEPIMIGTVHTHYPLTWAAKGTSKPCGPSGADNSSVWPGLVYDYTNFIYAGDAVNNPKNPLKVWPCGPQRRVAE